MTKIGIIGKTNTGKTTFFNAATSSAAEVSNYPFTTKTPNQATGRVQTLCVCRELGLTDKPVNSTCIQGWRFIPIEILDLPGLIKGAWSGRGLGTQFLNVTSQADALLHVVDASGSVDEEGKITRPGNGNPVADVYDIEEELVLWFKVAIDRALQRAKRHTIGKEPYSESIARELVGIGVKHSQTRFSLQKSNLELKHPADWSDDDSRMFTQILREAAKPTVIIANKMDLPYAERNFEKLRDEFKGQLVIPVCSEAELALRRAEEKRLIEYVPGEESFKVKEGSILTKEQNWALEYVQQRVMNRLMRTGVQFALNSCVFKLLGMNTVYPVEDPKGMSDRKGNVLPDAFLVSYNHTAKDLARDIHSELGEKMLYAIDVRNGLRLPSDYVLHDRDIISIISATRK